MACAPFDRRLVLRVPLIALVLIVVACSPARTREESATPSPGPSSAPRRLDGRDRIVVGKPIDVNKLEGKVVFDDFEDVYVMWADGSHVESVADRPGPEFDGAWSPDGRRIVYRDSRRGINENDEIFVVEADGTGARNLTRNPANDWGPDWSPDGKTIVFNSDRDGGIMGGYLMSPDGSNVRRIQADVWIEYPAFSPDGTKIVFMGHAAGDYDIYVADLATGSAKQITDTPGSDGWPVWSPYGSMIAFTSERDDCVHAVEDSACWVSGDIDEHHDIWVMEADGSGPRRVTSEFGQFVTWSPDGRYLLVSGYSLYVIRPDGTGRTDVVPGAGGIPDWTA